MNYKTFSSVAQAYKEAQKDAIKTNAMVFVGGSTYTVAEVLFEIQHQLLKIFAFYGTTKKL